MSTPKRTQLALFVRGDDLPLFTGAPDLGAEDPEVTPLPPVEPLDVGDRVEYIGLTSLRCAAGAEGLIRHVDGPGSFVVEFPTGLEVCYLAELRRVES